MSDVKLLIVSIGFVAIVYIVRWALYKAINKAGNVVEKSLNNYEQKKKRE